MVPVAAAVGPEPPDGLISGRPHILRLRPELATVPPERGRVPRRDQPTAAAAVASCDPARLDAVARIATTARAADAADACVVLPVDGAARRVFLGAAQLTGSGITDVHAKRKPRGDEIVLRLTTRGAEVPPVQWRVDLDGRVVGTVVRSGTGGLAPAADQPPASRLTITGPKIDGDRARTIADAIDQARGEQLIDLARRATMTRRARELLAAATAHVDDKPEFLDDCPSPETPGTLVLGCYDGRIFVLRVDRADLAPVMTVTAAHELLHAAYDDMSRTERRRVADELDAFMATTGDARIEELLAEYDKVQPGTRDNELHSLVGTQVRDLPAPLERHYRRYFADRSAVVDAFDAYQHVFDDLQARYDQLEVEVRSLEGELNGLQADARAAGDEADRLTSEIDSLRGQGRIDESNQLVEPQNAAVNRYNGLIGTFNARVDEYNTKVQELNALSITLENTYNEISPIAAQS
jgi:outer membrane murein-binding lipoprotein Lpp